MAKPTKISTGKEFRPAPQFRVLYSIYFLLIFVFAICSWYIPVLVFAPSIISMIISAFVIPILLATVYWIPKYYRSIIYKLTNSEMVWRRGVWFKNTGIVPYNRITNVDISQGPISRKLGIAALKIQTAGYSAPSKTSAEIRIEGMEEFEEIREMIMEFVRGRKPVAVETYEEAAKPTDPVLRELIKIRKLLEKPRK